jgi:nicotinamidase-related amidase
MENTMNEHISSIDPQQTALLVMDYQAAIVGMLPDSDALLFRMAEAIAIAREQGILVGYVRVAFEGADVAAISPNNKGFSQLASRIDSFRSDAPATAVHERLSPQPDDIVVRKVRVGAFSTTDLDQQLRQRGIDTLILAGISTSGVVLSTVRDAADKDYRLYVLADCCADLDDEVHRVLVEKVFSRQADVIAVGDLSFLVQAN